MRCFDGHCDTLARCMTTGEGLRQNGGHVDLARCAALGQHAQIFAVFADSSKTSAPLYTVAQQQHALLERECARNADLVCRCRTSRDVRAAWAAGKSAALLGIEGKGFLQLMKNFEWERCVLLAELLGEAQAAMDDACAWTNERQQFGKGIKTFQLVQEHIVEMQIELTNTRNFLYRTCWKMDNGIPVNNDAAMLKRYGAPALTDCCSRALQLMGGLGFTDETRVSRLMLDCRGFQIGGGTVEIMVHISGRGILKEYAKAAEDPDYLWTS